MQLEINREDYEKSIIRIFGSDDKPVGTGFLVTPGYVLTCAHVVLQAIGIKQEEFENYESQLEETISLDFPVLESERIDAKVIAWLPYKLASGDVAGLKLLSPEPEQTKPLLLTRISLYEIEQDSHSVYGFGSSNGGRSDAYKPKTNVAGGRYQFCKVEDPHDETIKPGFSGAPIWNEKRKCVIGIVATASDPGKKESAKAYAIPTEKLQPVLSRINALRLHDVLKQSLSKSGNDQDKLEFAIQTTLQNCNPNGYEQSYKEQLIDLAVDRAPAFDWENEGNLVRFATMLAWMSHTPEHIYELLAIWVKHQGFQFSELLERITREMKQQKILDTKTCQYLMVVVEQVETSDSSLRVSIWPVEHRPTYNPKCPPPPLAYEECLELYDLPEFIRKKHRKYFDRSTIPEIHLFVPRNLLSCGIEMLPFGRLDSILGSDYPFVMRTNTSVHPTSTWYNDDLKNKWEQLKNFREQEMSELFEIVDCQVLAHTDVSRLTELIDRVKPLAATILNNCVSIEGLLELLADEEDTALPVALWSRNPEFDEDLPELLECSLPVFLERIREERQKAKRPKSKDLIGHHISLLWEDPKIVPPNIYFDPEDY